MLLHSRERFALGWNQDVLHILLFAVCLLLKINK